MNIFISDSNKLKGYLSVTEDMGISLLPPDINKSREDFIKDGENIRFGLKGIRKMGKTSNAIVTEVDTRGEFETYQDFVVRMGKHHKINKGAIEGAIYSGALDGFEGTRRAKIELVPLLANDAKKEREAFEKGQVSLFDILPEESHLKEIKVEVLEEYEKRFKLEKEKEYAGLYLTEHPLDEYQEYFEGENIVEVRDLIELDEENMGTNEVNSGDRVKIVGIIEEKKIRWTKKGDPLYTFTIEGKSGSIGGVMFSRTIDKVGEKVADGNVVIIEGTYQVNDFGPQIIANDVKDITELRQDKEVVLVLNAIEKKQLSELQDNILSKKEHMGSIPVYITLEGKTFKANRKIKKSHSLETTLKNMFSDYKFVHLRE